ncbi:hypothetical protein IMZ11_02700 [Microtetraspora sp. AC03309]|uniref:hypothetical protein n=1 Tax=Microtetraspora sp. AC03309 TaxID=2779376 RepID=UPI001E4E78EC|nr:hypothetical protein [Microtetraspora sp. AC03309]MCC5574549.1 hypothetical protein [Microtetraspora sp. AC03309]
MTASKSARRTTVTYTRSFWTVVMDDAGAVGGGLLAYMLGRHLGGWEGIAATVAAALFLFLGVYRQSVYRRERNRDRVVSVELVRAWDRANPDARLDALNWVPAEILMEAREVSRG